MSSVPTRISAAANRAASVARKAADMAADRLAAPKADRMLAPRSDDRFTVVVHFAGDAASVYQLTQWLWPLEQLSRHVSVVILCRNARRAQQIAELTHLPVRFGRWMAQLEAMLGHDEVRCVLYVNQAMQNFQALHYARPAHVHLSHGESEKASMISNKLKAYDFVLTAGRAARQRLSTQLVGFGEERMVDVGRPQLDAPVVVPQAWTQHLDDAEAVAGATILWAPTWEGDSPSMSYGTLPWSGETLASDLVGKGARVIYRPHPRTGFLSKSFRDADERVREIVLSGGGFVDETAALGWQFEAADACIAEMSSVAFDWLATRKPLALIRPADERAESVPGGLFERVPSFDPDSAAQAVAAVLPGTGDEVPGESQGDPGTSVAAAAQHYLGDTAPGAQVSRFVNAVTGIAEERDEALRR